jgi:hypothetical protein
VHKPINESQNESRGNLEQINAILGYTPPTQPPSWLVRDAEMTDRCLVLVWMAHQQQNTSQRAWPRDYWWESDDPIDMIEPKYIRNKR